MTSNKIYTYKVNGKKVTARNVVEAMLRYHELYPNNDIRSVVRLGGNLA